MIILPVDQGFEHGPDKSFAVNKDAYDPEYHIKLAIEAGVNAYAAPIGMLELISYNYAGSVPLILKLNSNNSLSSKALQPNQAMTSSVKDAVRLGCSAVGVTIYPGSDVAVNLFEETKEVIKEARSYGLPTVIWSYPRGGMLKKEDESAIDICAYSGHIAAILGGHIIKLKLPSEHIALDENKKIYQLHNIKYSDLKDRVSHVMTSCFNYKRLVVFSGGNSKSDEELLREVQAIQDGGGNGSIIGRNSFQRKFNDSISILNKISEIYHSS
jgi:class I fructose-bisphosphate aldolase